MNLKQIVVVNDHAYISGGAAKVALSSAAALSEGPFSVILFSAVAPVMPELEQKCSRIVISGQHEIITHPNPMRAGLQGIWNFRAAGLMSALLDSLDPAYTVVHVHSWTKALSSSVIRMAVKKGFKVICTMHDYFIACPNGGFYNYQGNQICHEIPLSSKCMLKNCDMRSFSHKGWRIVRQVIQKKAGLIPEGINHFIAISDFSERILRAYLPRQAMVHRIDNPVDISKEDPVRVEENEAFISVGRLSKEKGQILFAMAAEHLGIRSIFIGEGECRLELTAANPSAHLTGWLPAAKVQENLRTARALIFSSLLYETQGLAVLEAAAMGVPAVVPDTSAARDSVINGVTGLWFRGSDADDLAEKMRMLLNGSFAARMGRAAYERYWRDPLTMNAHIERLIGTYQRMLEH